jgi:hypothetical protein
MTAKKGLKSLAESNPEFSNQQIENAVNELKIGWVAKTFTLDTAIKNNNVLTNTQKNNARLTINNQPHLNIGRYLNDMLAHTDTILDGTIIPLDDATNPTPSTFLDILQSVLSLQSTIPELLGVPASEKSRDVNDHLGTLNNKFLETEDSSLPVFTSLKESISFINANTVATDTLYQTALTNMTTFVDSVVGDSTDFQQTLDGHATAVATAATNFNTALGSEPYLTHRTRLITDNERVDVQVALEKSNLTNINTFLDNLNDYNSYTALAEDSELRKLMTRVSQNTNWITYFNEYEQNQANLNPLYTTDTDSDKSAVIDQVLSDSGLPDVTDPTDFEAVANKAKQDSRIDTRNYDRLTAEQQITDACKQLNITTANRVLLDQSRNLLNNLNQRDRDIIAAELDSNEDADTLT